MRFLSRCEITKYVGKKSPASKTILLERFLSANFVVKQSYVAGILVFKLLSMLVKISKITSLFKLSTNRKYSFFVQRSILMNKNLTLS